MTLLKIDGEKLRKLEQVVCLRRCLLCVRCSVRRTRVRNEVTLSSRAEKEFFSARVLLYGQARLKRAHIHVTYVRTV